jgi:3,4-dihydroxyphthalate decarboxylase
MSERPRTPIGSDDIERLRCEVATGCRVLAHRGLVENVLGHISVRVDDRRALVRCRGPEEAGLRLTTPDDVRLVDLGTGEVLDDPPARYSPPSELPIHTSVLAARPEVACVVHAHPPDVVTASLAGIDLYPIYGAYDIPGARLAADGIPVHPRSVLIRSSRLAAEMVSSLGPARALVLAGHGVVTTGGGVADAVLRAIQVDTLARLHLRVRSAGATPAPVPAADLAELPDLGTGLNLEALWRHHCAALHHDDPVPDPGRPRSAEGAADGDD